MTQEQKNMCGEYRFRLLEDGILHCISSDYSGTPADLCAFFGVEVPCYTQFLRVLNYDEQIHLEYRSYNAATARVNISFIAEGSVY